MNIHERVMCRVRIIESMRIHNVTLMQLWTNPCLSYGRNMYLQLCKMVHEEYHMKYVDVVALRKKNQMTGEKETL